MEEVKVSVVWYADRDCYLMRYREPMTGKLVSRSAKTNIKRVAEREAAKWENELREGRYKPASKITWAEFRTRYEDEVLAGLASRTDLKVSGVMNKVEEIVSPRLLRDVTAERLSFYQSKLRDLGLSESTIAGHLAHLKAALRWAVGVGMLAAAPKIEKPKRAKGAKLMKGRPITREEFERMLAKVPAIVGDAAADDWRRLLEGLWLSGLRLGEALNLYWDRTDRIRVDFDGPRPMLYIPAELEKGHKDRLLPLAPEFAEWLAAVPVERRYGPVFSLTVERTGARPTDWWVSRAITKIGEKAGVKVDEKPGKPTKENPHPENVVKFASAHDLRRAFGERWASRVMPQVLMQLMRHESIETTLKFYVGRNAEKTADVLWEAHEAQRSNSLGNKAPSAGEGGQVGRAAKSFPLSGFEVDGAGIEPATHGFSVQKNPQKEVE